ncbi:MAG TPA: hypothetical protein VIP11_05755 [Gemmatimonadaceae bacterium]
MPNPVAQDVAHASVVAGGANGFETHYLRAGRGSSILVLASDPKISEALISDLPRRFRSIAPKLPLVESAPPPEFNPWLRGFLDALGIARTAIVAGPCHAAQVIGFTLNEPERVSRIVFLLGICGEWAGDGEDWGRGIADKLGIAGQPLLVTPLDPTDETARARVLADIVTFLERVEENE